MIQNKPVRTIRDGVVSVSIWKNEAEGGKNFYSLKPQKRYTKDDGDTWETSNSYSQRDAILLANLLTDAANWIRVNLEVEKQINGNN